MKPKAIAGRVLLAATLAAAAPASAAIITTTYEGTVSQGFDQTGVFGTAGRNLAGLHFKTVYTTNDGLAGLGHYDDGQITQVYGGPAFAGGPDPVTALLTIGSATISLGIGDGGFAYRNDGEYGYDDLENGALTVYPLNPSPDGSYVSRYIVNEVTSWTADMVSDRHYGAPLVYHVTPDNYDGGYYADNAWDGVAGALVYNNFATFATETITISSTGGGVPEPATWALMLTGFGLAGAALRRRRTGEAVTA